MRRLPGFTLIELLVVVGIISILGAMLFPTATGYIRRSNIGKSANNLRQLGILTGIYATENDGRLPVYDTVNSNYSWVSALYKMAYAKDFTGFQPQATGLNLKGTIFYSPVMQVSEGTPLRSYAINQYLRNDSVSPEQDNRITLLQVAAPSRAMLFADAKHSSASGTPQSLTYRNEEKVIVCFVDGHVEMRMESEVPEVKSTEGTTFWLHQ